MPKNLLSKMVLMGMALLTLILGGTVPLVAQIHTANLWLRERRVILERLQTRISNLPHLATEYGLVQKNLPLINQAFLEPEKIVDFVSQIEKKASELGMTLTILPGPTKKDSGWQSFQIRTKGSFRALVEFLNFLETTQPQVKTTSFQLEKVPTEPESSPLQAQITIEVRQNKND